MTNLTHEEQHSYLFPERQLPYAGFLRRLAALVIDTILLLPVSLLIRFVIEGDINFWSGSVFSFSGLIDAIADWLYFAILESGIWQATVGKRLMGIRVCSVNGDRVSFGRATARYFSKILSFIILLIGYLMMLWDDRKQTLHDKIADTLVVKG